MPETPEKAGTLTGTPTVSGGPDSLELTHEEAGAEIVNTAAEEEEWDMVGGLVDAAGKLWVDSLTRNGEEDVLDPVNLQDTEFIVGVRPTNDMEIATYVDVALKIGRTIQQLTFRVDDDKQSQLTAFLNDRMNREADGAEWDPQKLLNLLDEIGQLVDISIRGKVQGQKTK